MSHPAAEIAQRLAELRASFAEILRAEVARVGSVDGFDLLVDVRMAQLREAVLFEMLASGERFDLMDFQRRVVALLEQQITHLDASAPRIALDLTRISPGNH